MKLKRKLEYKNTHTEQLIDTNKIYQYLNYLKNIAKNKNYQFFDNVDIYIKRCQEFDPKGLKLLVSEEDELTEILNSCNNKYQIEDEVDIEEKKDSEQPDDETDDEKDEIEYQTKDPVRKHQFDYDKTTCMTQSFLKQFPEVQALS